MSTEYGWLIENGKQAGAGLAYRFIDNDAGGVPSWTADHNKALRFARRADAEQFAYHDEDAWRIVQHAWADLPANATLRDALWICVEHNALHFGDNHNTVVKGRAALASAAQRDLLRDFARAVMQAWPEGGVDGGELQDIALAHGLLRPAEPPTDWDGCNFYEKTELIK